MFELCGPYLTVNWTYFCSFVSGTGVTVNCVNPGIVDTEITRHMSFYSSWLATILVKPFVWPFIKSPKQGSQTVIYLAIDDRIQDVTGKYFRY